MKEIETIGSTSNQSEKTVSDIYLEKEVLGN